jgi:hypothetical protein
MKPAKLALITTLLAFSVALASAASDSPAPAQQPTGEGRINRRRQIKQLMTMPENTKRLTTRETQKRSPGSIPTMLTTLIRTARRLKDGMPCKSFWPIIFSRIPA